MKYLNWFLGMVVVVIAVIIGSILIKNIISDNQIAEKAIVREYIANNVSDTSIIRLTISGPVVADEKHESLKIEITPSSRQLTLYKTYSDKEAKNIRLGNNKGAFTALSRALDKAGFTQGNRKYADAKYSGECSVGRVYRLEYMQDGETKSDLWSTSCRSGKESFGGNIASILYLLRSQFPSFAEDLRGSSLTF